MYRRWSMQGPRLEIHDFAQIKDATIQFGDLTVLVGEQGTGKSLVLQWLKAAVDGKYIVDRLDDAGQKATAETVVDLIFGVGMGSAWKTTTRITFDGREVTRSSIHRRGGD